MSRAKAGRAPVDKTTGRPLAIDKRDAYRYFDKKTKKEATDRLKGMRQAVRDAKKERIERLKAVQDKCREDLATATRAYEEAVEKVASARGGKKDARSKCSTSKRATREEMKGRIAAAKERRDEEAKDQARERARVRARARIKDPTEAARKKRAKKEERGESDDAVVQNLSPELLPLWNREKGRFKGPPHRRFEQFLEYVEAHPGDVLDAKEEAAGVARERELDRELAEEQARHYGFSLEAQSPRGKRGPRKRSAAERTREIFGPEVMLQRGRHAPGLAPPPALRLSPSPNDDVELRPRNGESAHIPF